MTAAGAEGTRGLPREATRAVLVPGRHGHRRHAGDAVRAGVGAAGVGATALLASGGALPAIEREVFETVNGLPQTASPRAVGRHAGGQLPRRLRHRRARARRPAADFAVALAAGGTTTWLLAKAVKLVVDRGRPEAVLHDVVVYGPSATGLGFPQVTPRWRPSS